MNVLILGSNGMLGHMVEKYLKQYYEIEIINHRWPSQDFKTAINNSNSDFLINCIGAIPQKTKNFDVNWELPIWLDNNFKGKIIHPGTDCEMDRDDYGISKRKAADWIISNGKRTKMIKSTIMGPELFGNSTLLGWFLSCKENSTINGYLNHMCNGVTTYYWAQFCRNLLNSWDSYKIRTIIGTECISKYELLNICKKVFNKNIIINKHTTGKFNINKCLVLDYQLDNMETQLKELKSYYYD